MMDQINQALREMAKSPNGGHATMATMLGLTPAALENRLYEIKGQQISIDQAMLMQRMTERTDFAEAVARESGGVFVPLPPVDAAAVQGLDIEEGFLDVFVQTGKLLEKWREVTQDGQLHSWESVLLWRQLHRLLTQLTGIAVQTDRIYGVFYDKSKQE